MPLSSSTGLGLRALYRRRHLRMPAGEAWQLGLGLAIPLLLIPHAGGVRIGSSAYGMDGGFDQVIYQFWVASPDFALPRQLLLLLVVWVHGCIGVRAWLASKPWYRRASAPLASLATLVPVVALLGFIARASTCGMRFTAIKPRSALRSCRGRAARAQSAAALDWIVNGLVVAYLALVAGVFALRAARDWHAKRFRALRITYPDQRVVVVPVGFSVLEASRWAKSRTSRSAAAAAVAPPAESASWRARNGQRCEPERAPDARSHPGPSTCPLGLPDPSLRRPVDRAARSPDPGRGHSGALRRRGRGRNGARSMRHVRRPAQSRRGTRTTALRRAVPVRPLYPGRDRRRPQAFGPRHQRRRRRRD